MDKIDDCRSQDVKNKEDYNQERIKNEEMLDEEEKMLEGEKWSKKDEMLEEKMSEERRWNKKEEMSEEKMSEERRWKEDTLRKLANIQIKKADQTRRKECLREKGKGSRTSEENLNMVEVLVSRDGYNLID